MSVNLSKISYDTEVVPNETNEKFMFLKDCQELTKLLLERVAIIEHNNPKDFISHAEVERRMNTNSNEV